MGKDTGSVGNNIKGGETVDYNNPEEIMAENLEITELNEQFENTAEIDSAIEYYTKSSLDALAEGNRDMKEYYDAKADELYEVRKEFVKQDSQQWYEQFSERMDKSIAETDELLDELKKDKAVHGAPRYGGELDYSEREWRYEAEKELKKNGETARYKELLDKAEEAKAEKMLDNLKHK